MGIWTPVVPPDWEDRLERGLDSRTPAERRFRRRLGIVVCALLAVSFLVLALTTRTSLDGDPSDPYPACAPQPYSADCGCRIGHLPFVVVVRGRLGAASDMRGACA